MRWAVYTNHSACNADLARVVGANTWDYTSRHGYDLVTARLDWERSKVQALYDIRQLLGSYDGVMSVGSDVLFMHHPTTIESRLEVGDCVVLAKECIGGSWINNDVMLWLPTADTIRLLDTLISSKNDWLGYEWLWQRWLGDKLHNPGKEWEWLLYTCRLVDPRVMNSTVQNTPSRYQPGDWILHLLNHSNSDKLRLAKEWLPKVIR